MANTETSVTELKINKLTKAQYEGIVSPSNTELYFVKDEAIDYNDLVNTPDLADVATSGSYNDLTDKPDIIQSNWIQDDQTKIDYIKNKPALKLVATSGSYNDLTDKPSITSLLIADSSALLTSGGAYTTLVSNVIQGSSEDKINVTKSGTTSTITVNNVAHATNADVSTKLGTSTVGSTTRPIYLNNGVATQIDYTIAKSVPSDAQFTDTTYSVFTGATSITDGTAGLVKKPLAGDQNKYLQANGEWTIVDALPSQSGNNGKFLTTNGISASWTTLSSVAVSGSYNDLSNKPYFNGIQLNNSISPNFYGTSNSAADATAKTVSIPSITKLEAGQIIIVQPTITSTVANSTLQLNDFDPYPMIYSGAAITTSTDSQVWNSSYPTTWLFDGTNWIFLSHGIDNNTTYSALGASYDAGQYTSGTGNYAITRYSLILAKPNGTWEKVTATNATYSTATSKSVNTSGFILGQIRYFSAKTELGANTLTAANAVYDKSLSVDMRYSTNCGATTNWSAGNYIYLVGTIGVDGLFYLDTTSWWSNALPSSNDGKVYVRLGHALVDSGYTMTLYPDHPVFYHNGTRICEYKIADNKQDLLVSGTNIKTFNNSSLLGSGNISITGLPSQTSQSGKFLTTNGTNASWATIDAFPSQTGNAGKYLTTNGTNVSWTSLTWTYDNATETLTIM